jgi:release factor glutamine methyltransferase
VGTEPLSNREELLAIADERALDPYLERELGSGVTIAAARRALARAFARCRLDIPELDARILIGHAIGLDHAQLVTQGDRLLDAASAGRICALAERRLAREPVARIIGGREFWGLPIMVSPATLVPRPETETVVESALAVVEAQRARNDPIAIADLGTGSGAILVALLAELPRAVGIGTDCDAAALITARANAERLGFAARAQFVGCHFAAAVSGPFDLIVSNPPYVRSADIAGLAPEVRAYDPLVALDGGPDGLDAYHAIAADAARLLKPGGHLVVEIGEGQAAAVRSIFGDAGFKATASSRCDLAGIERALDLVRV